MKRRSFFATVTGAILSTIPISAVGSTLPKHRTRKWLCDVIGEGGHNHGAFVWATDDELTFLRAGIFCVTGTAKLSAVPVKKLAVVLGRAPALAKTAIIANRLGQPHRNSWPIVYAYHKEPTDETT